jgi:predicted GNAT family N-acyltransferase
MKANDNIEDRYEEGMITSLCYLHQEAVKNNDLDIAELLGDTIEAMQNKISNQSLSNTCQNWLQQFYLLRGFQALSFEQKQVFLREIEDAEKFKVN